VLLHRSAPKKSQKKSRGRNFAGFSLRLLQQRNTFDQFVLAPPCTGANVLEKWA
jgi:hypothetical protein